MKIKLKLSVQLIRAKCFAQKFMHNTVKLYISLDLQNKLFLIENPVQFHCTVHYINSNTVDTTPLLYLFFIDQQEYATMIYAKTLVLNVLYK